MTPLVPIQSGQWVLSYLFDVGPSPGREDLTDALERLQFGGSGWDFLRHAEQQFAIVQVAHVRPKTFRDADGGRHWRDLVIAAADTAGELETLRDKLFAIGFKADRAIEEEAERLVAVFAAKTRADALREVHAALPHIFGRQQ